MNPITINTKVTFTSGLFYRLLDVYGPVPIGRTTDLCTLMWSLVWGLLVIVGIIAFGVLATAVIVLEPLIWAAWMIFNGQYIQPNAAVVAAFAVVWGPLLLVAAWYLVKYLGPAKPKQPSIVSQVYSSIKNRYCILVEFK